MNGFGPLMAEAAARSAVLGLCIALALAAWRRAPARIAHAAWLFVLAAMLAMPILTAAAPRLRLPVLSAVAPAAAASRPAAAAAGWDRTDSGRPAPARLDLAAAPAAAPPGALGWRPLLAGAYLLGLGLGLAGLLRGFVVLRRIRREREAIEDPAAQALLGSLLPGRAVTLWSAATVRVPLTFGILRPCILLPEDWRAWPPAKLEAVLAHEASHVRRGDSLWLLAAHLNRCVHWFNPFSWLVLRRLSSLAEEIGDEAAVGRLGDRVAYARSLVEVARPMAGRGTRTWHSLPALSMALRSDLTSRVERVLAMAESAPKGLSRTAASLATVALTAAVSLAGTVSLAAAPATADPARDPRAELRSTDPDRAAAAAFELARSRGYDERTVGDLMAMLADDRPLERVPRWNSRIDGWQPSYPSWDEPSVGAVATICLASMGRRVAGPLVAALADGDPVVRRNAAWGLGEIRGRSALPDRGRGLIALLDDEAPSVSSAAAFSLGEYRVKAAVPGLIRVLRQGADARARAMAAYALGEIRAEAAQEALSAALKDPDPDVRREAKKALREVL